MLSVIDLCLFYGGVVLPAKAQPDNRFDLTVLLILDNRQPLSSQLHRAHPYSKEKGTMARSSLAPVGLAARLRAASNKDPVLLLAANTTFLIPQRLQCSSLLASPSHHFIHLYSPVLRLVAVSPYLGELIGMDSTPCFRPTLSKPQHIPSCCPGSRKQQGAGALVLSSCAKNQFFPWVWVFMSHWSTLPD